MGETIRNILITGKPGRGKTTLIKKLAGELADLRPRGFYTEEIREGGKRKGFAIKGLDGRQRGILAHVDIKSPFRVGRYGVDVEGFEGFLYEIGDELFSGGIILIDEIGKMECFSKRFVEIIKRCLGVDIPFVATVSEKGGGFIGEIKRRSDVIIVSLTPENRDSMPERITRLIEEILRV